MKIWLIAWVLACGAWIACSTDDDDPDVACCFLGTKPVDGECVRCDARLEQDLDMALGAARACEVDADCQWTYLPSSSCKAGCGQPLAKDADLAPLHALLEAWDRCNTCVTDCSVPEAPPPLACVANLCALAE